MSRISPKPTASEESPAGLIGFDFDLTLSCFRVYGRTQFHCLPRIFGGDERVALLQRYFAFLSRHNVRIVVISWNFEAIIREALESLELMLYVHSIYDRGVIKEQGGYRDGKGSIISALRKAWSIPKSRTVFVDDSHEILERVTCNTVWVNESGMVLVHMRSAADKLGLDFK